MRTGYFSFALRPFLACPLKKYLLSASGQPFQAEIRLPASKSESNRALILNALAGGTAALTNLSEARDTQTMQRLLASPDPVADVLDAGTTMRFLTAYFAVTGQQKLLTGTPRMQERPIGILVEALRALGADVVCEKAEGYPPLRLRGFRYSGQNYLRMRGDVSSQFISAILMIAPLLPEGLTLELTGELGSIPYIEMTLAQMRHFGAEVQADWSGKTLQVTPKPYVPRPFAVESDWSGASYWYALVALAPEGSAVELLGLKENSLQGDSVVAELMRPLGVRSDFTGRGYRLTKQPTEARFSWDFTQCPDLAQTVAVLCAAKRIPATFTGLESLKVKETDRVYALQTELRKFGADLAEVEPNATYEVRSRRSENADFVLPTSSLQIDTYDDHRMAMAFAPLALVQDVVIENPDVVVKSYPRFWDDLGRVLDVRAD